MACTIVCFITRTFAAKSFTFLKLDNSIRDARGTTNPLLIPADDRPKHNPESMPGYKHNHAIITFYDIDARGWRSFDIRRYIGMAKYYPLSKHPVTVEKIWRHFLTATKEKRTKRENHAGLI